MPENGEVFFVHYVYKIFNVLKMRDWVWIKFFGMINGLPTSNFHKKWYDYLYKITNDERIVFSMNISQAVAFRILELCKERKITVNRLSTISAVTQSTVNDIVNNKSKNIGIATIRKLCDGLEISITDFFDTPYFRNLEQEIYWKFVTLSLQKTLNI